VEEFTHASKALAPLAPTLASLEMVSALLALHPSDIDSIYLDFLLDFKPDLDLELFVDFFRLIFLCMFCLLASGPFGMVFKHL
jgi:hypothetical protein